MTAPQGEESRLGGQGLEPRLKGDWRHTPGARIRIGLAARLRSRIRASELMLVVVAVFVGAAAGGLTAAVSFFAHALQGLLYGIEPGERLSALQSLDPVRALALPAGGAGPGRWPPGPGSRADRAPPVDPVEANALHGGRMSVRDSLFVGLQSVISNGFGASVGLEAAYAQLGGGFASRDRPGLEPAAQRPAHLRRRRRRRGHRRGVRRAAHRRLLRLRDHHRLLHRRQHRPGGGRRHRRHLGEPVAATRADGAAIRRQRFPDRRSLSAVRGAGRGLRRSSASPSCGWWP